MLRIALATLSALLASCDHSAPVGTETGACYGNGTCNIGLTCLSGLCVILPDATLGDAGLLAIDGGVPDACHAPDAVAPDALSLDCSDDSSLEPNDSTATAWTTPIPASSTDISLNQLSICPDTDRDLYRFGVEVNGHNMRATVTAVVADGELLLQILNAGGAVIGNGQVSDLDTIFVAVNNLAVGTYYVRVAAPIGVQNNYTLDIVTCTGAPCP